MNKERKQSAPFRDFNMFNGHLNAFLLNYAANEIETLGSVYPERFCYYNKMSRRTDAGRSGRQARCPNKRHKSYE